MSLLSKNCADAENILDRERVKDIVIFIFKIALHSILLLSHNKLSFLYYV